MVAMSGIELEAGQGILGDQSYGRANRQVLLVDLAIVTSYSLQPGWLRENITTTGIDLKTLHKGDILDVGSSHLEIVGDCTPCSRLDDIRLGLQQEIEGDRGILARVIRSGKIQLDDPITQIGK
jgi:MOSC domain-containing protein YiiM